jgi:hypothetical protein
LPVGCSFPFLAHSFAFLPPTIHECGWCPQCPAPPPVCVMLAGQTRVCTGASKRLLVLILWLRAIVCMCGYDVVRSSGCGHVCDQCDALGMVCYVSVLATVATGTWCGPCPPTWRPKTCTSSAWDTRGW